MPDKRAFVVVIHEVHGYVLLTGKRKPKKGKPEHAQLPGGRLDPGESYEAAAIRELHEETGLVAAASSLVELLPGTDQTFEKRRYWMLLIGDHNSVGDAATATTTRGPGLHSATTGEQGFRLRLSKEHVGFQFERDLAAAADAIQLHSQGFNSAALRQAASQLEAATAVAGTSQAAVSATGGSAPR